MNISGSYYCATMKILYDYQIFDEQVFGGISNCFIKLIENLPIGYEGDIAIKESDNVHLRASSIFSHVEKRKDHGRGFFYRQLSKVLPSLTTSGRNKEYSIQSIRNGNYDVFHPTFFSPYFLKYLPMTKPFVITVHDMVPELYFKNYDIQVKWKPLLCEKASHIVAVSENTKRDLIEMLNVPENKITVIYHGAPEYKDFSRSRSLMLGRYILYVGQRNSYKNFMPMIHSLRPVLQRHPDIKVVCTGPDFTNSEKRIFRELGLFEKVVHLSVNDSEMASLYHNALCFIYPSAYEGFGIPILEAFRANCPVMLNETSCFPEIAQDAALYFHLDEHSSDLEEKIEEFLSKDSFDLEALMTAQQKRLDFFSWRASSSKLADVYNDCIYNNSL